MKPLDPAWKMAWYRIRHPLLSRHRAVRVGHDVLWFSPVSRRFYDYTTGERWSCTFGGSS
jgi:hypothetical protein